MADTDLLIIGSGPIGAAFARLVAEQRPGTRITMVELGPVISAPPGANVRNLAEEDRDAARTRAQGPDATVAGGRMQDSLRVEGTIVSPGGTYLAAPGHQDGMPAAALSSCVGGMGAHWTCATPTPNDDERIPFIPDAELRAAFADAERLLHVTTLPDNPYTSSIRSLLDERIDPTLPEDRRSDLLPMSAIPHEDGMIEWGGADTVLGHTPVDLQSETLCRRVIVDGDTVIGAELLHRPTGRVETITADVVVVAANAFQTPQLLWASGIRPEPLGRYLTEHSLVFSVVALSDEVFDRAETDLPVGDIVKDPTASTIGIPYTRDLHPYRTQVMHMADPPVPVPDGVSVSSAGFVSMGNGVRVFPRADNRVVFSAEDEDQWGMPQMTIEFALDDAEREDIDGAVDDLRRVGSRLGTFIAGPRIMPPGTSLHYKGTVRMGVDDGERSVVDDHSKVWGFRNLFLGGNGLIPTATVSNPTLTSVALAVLAVPSVVAVLAAAAEAE